MPLGARDRIVDAVTPDGIVTEASDNIDWGKVSKWRDTQPSPSPETSVVPLREQMLESALTAAVETIKDYLAYEHDGDPWKEDSRAMGEMDINDYGRDGRLDYALKLLVATEGSAR